MMMIMMMMIMMMMIIMMTMLLKCDTFGVMTVEPCQHQWCFYMMTTMMTMMLLDTAHLVL